MATFYRGICQVALRPDTWLCKKRKGGSQTPEQWLILDRNIQFAEANSVYKRDSFLDSEYFA